MVTTSGMISLGLAVANVFMVRIAVLNVINRSSTHDDDESR